MFLAGLLAANHIVLYTNTIQSNYPYNAITQFQIELLQYKQLELTDKYVRIKKSKSNMHVESMGKLLVSFQTLRNQTENKKNRKPNSQNEKT